MGKSAMPVQSRRRWSVWVACGVLCVASVYWLLPRGRIEPTKRSVARLSVWPELGEKRIYEVRLTTAVRGASRDLGDLTLMGKWVLEGIANDASGHLIRTTIEQAELTSELAEPTAQQKLAAGARDFARPLVLEVDEHGGIKGVREDIEARMQARSLQKALATFAQLVRPQPNQENAASYETHEDDAVGTYTARYQAGEHEQTIQKSKIRYDQIRSNPSGLAQATYQIASGTTIFSGERGLAVSIRAEEVVTAKSPQFDELTTTTAMTAKFLRSERIHPNRDEVRSLHVSKLHQPAGLDRFSMETDEIRAAGQNFEEVMEAFSSLPPLADRSPDELREGSRYYISLTALMRVDPHAIPKAMGMIEQGSDQSRTLWNAMGTAGTVGAQAALRTLIDMPKWDWEERRSQMIGLSMVKEPTRETIEFLHSKFDDPEQKQQARYGVGTAVYNLKGGRPEDAREAFEILRTELSASKDPYRIADLLVALGNTGYPDAFALVAPYMASEHETMLRSSAAQGLRMIPGTEPDVLLAQAAKNDPAFTVRMSAVGAMRFRLPTKPLASSLFEVAQVDPEADVRSLAVQVFADYVKKIPELAPALDQLRSPATGT